MAGGYKKIHEHPKAGTNALDKNPQNINRKGRPPSIATQVKEILTEEGRVTIPASQIHNINDDGSVTLILPTQMQIAMKLVGWAMSKKGNDSLKAIEMIHKVVDNPAMNIKVNTASEYEDWTEEELEAEIKRLRGE